MLMWLSCAEFHSYLFFWFFFNIFSPWGKVTDDVTTASYYLSFRQYFLDMDNSVPITRSNYAHSMNHEERWWYWSWALLIYKTEIYRAKKYLVTDCEWCDVVWSRLMRIEVLKCSKAKTSRQILFKQISCRALVSVLLPKTTEETRNEIVVYWFFSKERWKTQENQLWLYEM